MQPSKGVIQKQISFLLSTILNQTVRKAEDPLYYYDDYCSTGGVWGSQTNAFLSTGKYRRAVTEYLLTVTKYLRAMDKYFLSMDKYRLAVDKYLLSMGKYLPAAAKYVRTVFIHHFSLIFFSYMPQPANSQSYSFI